MRFFFNYFLCVCLIGTSQFSFAQVVLNVKNFGAVGDGKRDDTKAFQQLFKRVNEIKKNVTVIIPAGNYLLHPQIAASEEQPTAFFPLNIIALSNCNNITIKGSSGSKISFASKMYYGAFKRKGKGIEKLDRVTTEWQYRVAIGHGISIENSAGIAIRDLEIDGNNRSFILGGQFGDVGLQIDNDGIFIKDGININLTNVNLHHFGRDGILILNKTPQGFTTPLQNISLTNCRFEYNGRQGFSWAGGTGVTATSCSFSYSGKATFSSPPGAGVDFEPNAGYVVKGALFVNCHFRNNSGVAVIADEGGFNARDVQFENCELLGETAPALWVKSPAFQFRKCHIMGTFYFGCAANSPEEGTRFYQCSFSDEKSAKSATNYLVESNGAKYLVFDKCRFVATSKGMLYIATSAGMERALLINCLLISKYKNAAKAGSFTTGTEYMGTTSFIDSGEIRSGWNIERSRFGGYQNVRADVQVGNGFTLVSYDSVYVGNNATLSIKDGALLSSLINGKLTVAEGAKLVIKKGGSLWLAPEAELIVKGKLIAEEGSYLCIHFQAKLSEASKKNVIVSGNTKYTDHPQLKYGLGGCIILSP